MVGVTTAFPIRNPTSFVKILSEAKPFWKISAAKRYWAIGRPVFPLAGIISGLWMCLKKPATATAQAFTRSGMTITECRTLPRFAYYPRGSEWIAGIAYHYAAPVQPKHSCWRRRLFQALALSGFEMVSEKTESTGAALRNFLFPSLGNRSSTAAPEGYQYEDALPPLL